MHRDLSVARDLVESRDLVDVDEMRGLGQPERHDRHQALPAGQHAAVLRPRLRPKSSAPRRASRHVADERRGLHAANRSQGAKYLYANDKARPRIVKPAAARAMNLFVGRATNGYRKPSDHPKERAMSRKIILSLVAAATLAGAALSSGSADAMISRRVNGGHPNGHINVHWRFHEHRHFVRWHNHFWVRPVGYAVRGVETASARPLHLPDQELHAGRPGGVRRSVHQGICQRAGRRLLRCRRKPTLPPTTPARPIRITSRRTRRRRTNPTLYVNRKAAPRKRGRPCCIQS